MGRGSIQATQPGDINVRRAKPDERRDIYTVFYRSVREGASAYYTKEQRAAWAPDIAPPPKRFEAGDSRLHWVAEYKGQIIGNMALTPDGYLDLAFVLPEWMGRGVAQAIYEPLHEWAMDADLKRLTTHASHYARRFFERQGWQVDTPETIARNGQKLERFAMSLCLETLDEETL